MMVFIGKGPNSLRLPVIAPERANARGVFPLLSPTVQGKGARTFSAIPHITYRVWSVISKIPRLESGGGLILRRWGLDVKTLQFWN